MKRVMYIENNVELGQKIANFFKGEKFKSWVYFRHVQYLEEANFILSNEVYDIIFIDLGVDHAPDEDIEKYGGEVETDTDHCSGLELILKLQAVKPDVAKAYTIVFTGNPIFDSCRRYYERLSKPKDFKVKEIDDDENINFFVEIIKSKNIK